MEEMANIYAKLKNQYEFKYQLTFLAIFDKFGEAREVKNQIELPFTLSVTQILLNLR